MLQVTCGRYLTSQNPICQSPAPFACSSRRTYRGCFPCTKIEQNYSFTLPNERRPPLLALPRLLIKQGLKSFHLVVQLLVDGLVVLPQLHHVTTFDFLLVDHNRLIYLSLILDRFLVLQATQGLLELLVLVLQMLKHVVQLKIRGLLGTSCIFIVTSSRPIARSSSWFSLNSSIF
jgi:hypothetical protein